MTRIRSIKPEMPGNHRVAQVSRDARLMLVWLITDADDEGRLPATPKRLAGQLFPHDEDVNSEQILAWLLELETAGLIVQYSVKGAPFVEICGWFEHQKISKPSPSRFPPRYAADFWDETANCQVNDGPRETQGNPGKPRLI